MSQCGFVIRKITKSGNSSEKLQPHKKGLAALTKAQQEHLQDAKNKMVARCKEQSDRLSTAEGGTSTNCPTFALVLSADYQQAKLIPCWGGRSVTTAGQHLFSI